MENRYKINFDIKINAVTDIKFKQGDIDTSTLEITLFDDGSSVDITGEEIEFRFLKADNTIVYQNATSGISILDERNGKVQCIIKSNTLAVAGVVICEIHRSKDGKELTMPSFNFVVESSIGKDGILSANYISIIDDKLVEMNSAEADRVIAEDIRISNESDRVIAEDIRISNEGLRGADTSSNSIYINVKSFGAVGDGITDDTTAINSAIALAMTGITTNCVYFPAGKYITQGIAHARGIMYLGCGSGISQILHKDGYPTPVIHITGGTDAYVACPYYGFEGVSIRGGSQSTALVYYDGPIDNQVRFVDLQFGGAEGVVTDGLSVSDYLNWHIDRVRFDKIGGWAINVRDAKTFTHSIFSMSNFTYDNGSLGATGGMGLMYMDTTNMSAEKGIVSFKDARIEVNRNLITFKPSNSVIRFVQNNTRLDTLPPQIMLNLENITVDVNAKSKEIRLISNDYREISLNVRNMTVYGLLEIYNNDLGTSKNAIPGHLSAVIRISQIVSDDTRYEVAYNSRLNKFLGMNRTHVSSDNYINQGVYRVGDFSYYTLPFNSGGRVGRPFAYKAVQNVDGRCNGLNAISTIGTGTMNTGENTITTISPIYSSSCVPGQSIDIPGAGKSGATLTAMITAIDFTNKIITVNKTASTTVVAVTITTTLAKMAVVDMVFYGTAIPTTGDWQQGDKMINTSPTASGYLGWVCVTTGSPGVWKGFGLVQA
ncbi:BppU family phage baseplate upper protein [Clostridium sp.]|uniref:BppU family phage baseplate upper protein n=1 Tax=Clostridium sp. TaxID=1506 RepID=UPI003D6C8636